MSMKTFINALKNFFVKKEEYDKVKRDGGFGRVESGFDGYIGYAYADRGMFEEDAIDPNIRFFEIFDKEDEPLSLFSSTNIKVGSKIKLHFNDKIYDLSIKSTSIFGNSFYHIGNLKLGLKIEPLSHLEIPEFLKLYNDAEDTGEDFCIKFVNDEEGKAGYKALMAAPLNDYTLKFEIPNEKVYKIDEKFLPTSLPDWNENNPESPAYIKNRPFYEEVMGEQVLFEGEIVSNQYGEQNLKVFPEQVFSPGDKIIITKNNIDYTFYVDSGNIIHNPDDGAEYLRLTQNRAGEYHLNIHNVEWLTGHVKIKKILINNIHKFHSNFIKFSESLAMGTNTRAKGMCSFAEGYGTTASGDSSHAEGYDTTASDWCSHAEGYDTAASNSCSHAEGYDTTASGWCSHAEGYYTKASGDGSHAEGYFTTANHCSQHVEGEFNVLDDSTNEPSSIGNYVHIVGNGVNGLDRSNAHTLDWSGNAWYAGDVYVGSTSGKNKDDGSKKLATEEYVQSLIDALRTELGLPS